MPIVTGIALVALLFGLAMLWGLVLLGYRSGRWPTVLGTITDAYVATQHTSDEPSFNPQVEYRFVVGGKQYVGYRLRAFLWMQTSRAPAAEWLGRYPVGAVVRVHYNPACPEVCLLEPGLRAWDVAATAIYLLVCILVAVELVSQL